MFVTKKEFLSYQQEMARRHNDLMNRYWELKDAHKRLLEHFRLHEIPVAAHTVLRYESDFKEELEQRQ